MSNEIKEVKKILNKGMYSSDRCWFCREFGEKVEPFLCEDCRQKIFSWINSKGWTIHQFEPKPDECRARIEEIFSFVDTELIPRLKKEGYYLSANDWEQFKKALKAKSLGDK